MAVRAIRGATQLDVDERKHLIERVAQLLQHIVDLNDLDSEDIISILFTSTPDLTSEFPAVAAREVGLRGVPLIGTSEVDVPHGLPRTIRVMFHVETTRSRAELHHVYLHGATALIPNVAATEPK